MARLTDATETFIASLEKAQYELELVANKLEQEFAQRYKGKDINPLDLLNRIYKMKREIPLLVDECTQLLQAKQACVDAARQQLGGNTDSLNRLERKAGIIADASRHDTAVAFEQALEEHDKKLQLAQNAGIGGAPIDREELRKAFVNSVVV